MPESDDARIALQGSDDVQIALQHSDDATIVSNKKRGSALLLAVALPFAFLSTCSQTWAVRRGERISLGRLSRLLETDEAATLSFLESGAIFVGLFAMAAALATCIATLSGPLRRNNPYALTIATLTGAVLALGCAVGVLSEIPSEGIVLYGGFTTFVLGYGLLVVGSALNINNN